jgi:hypothetical protein
MIEDSERPANSAQVLDYLKDWIEVDGSALEMRTAAAFRKAFLGSAFQNQFNVEISRTYVNHSDLTHDTKLREIDVLVHSFKCINSKIWLGLWLVVECKTSTHPWLFYQGEGRISDSQNYDEFWFNKGASNFKLENVYGFNDFDLINVRRLPYSYGVSSANKGNRNVPRDAIRQVLSGVTGISDSVNVEPAHVTGDIFIPIVVTNAPMFTANLDSEGEIVLKETKRQLVVNRFNSLKEEYEYVWVVHESITADIADALLRTMQELDYRF